MIKPQLFLVKSNVTTHTAGHSPAVREIEIFLFSFATDNKLRSSRSLCLRRNVPNSPASHPSERRTPNFCLDFSASRSHSYPNTRRKVLLFGGWIQVLHDSQGESRKRPTQRNPVPHWVRATFYPSVPVCTGCKAQDRFCMLPLEVSPTLDASCVSFLFQSIGSFSDELATQPRFCHVTFPHRQLVFGEFSELYRSKLS